MDSSLPQATRFKKNNAKDLLSGERFYVKLLAIILATICLFAVAPAYAAKQSILIITDNRLSAHNDISTLLLSELQKNKKNSAKVLHYQNAIPEQLINFDSNIIITLGKNASKLTLPASTPTIHALIPQNSISKKDSLNINSYFIYLDQPISRQLKFLTLLLPSAKKVGILTAAFSSKKLPTLSVEAKRLSLTLRSEHVNEENDFNRKLNKLIKEIDILFTLPDPLIHNRANIPFLLLSTYRYNIPVIGFSEAYAHAGAIAALYSSPAQIVQQISELSQQILQSRITISSHHFPPRYFSIIINKNVVRSLDLKLPSTQSIKTKLLLLEK